MLYAMLKNAYYYGKHVFSICILNYVTVDAFVFEIGDRFHHYCSGMCHIVH